VSAEPEVDPATNLKRAKTPFDLVPLDFVGAMARVFAAGLKDGREPHDWKKLDPEKWLPEYRSALIRHLESASRHYALDDSGESHYAAVAVNACICWYFEKRLGS
jgi:hypothetical protein